MRVIIALMSFAPWLTENWFQLLQSIGIVGSLFYAARSFQFGAKVQRSRNLIEITGHHREIWSQLYRSPELSRVREEHPDLGNEPITVAEELFVTQVILHLSSAFRASKQGVISSIEGTEADVRRFFSNPIPREVWNRKREFQDRDFAMFMERQMVR